MLHLVFLSDLDEYTFQISVPNRSRATLLELHVNSLSVIGGTRSGVSMQHRVQIRKDGPIFPRGLVESWLRSQLPFAFA